MYQFWSRFNSSDYKSKTTNTSLHELTNCKANLRSAIVRYVGYQSEAKHFLGTKISFEKIGSGYFKNNNILNWNSSKKFPVQLDIVSKTKSNLSTEQKYIVEINANENFYRKKIQLHVLLQD